MNGTDKNRDKEIKRQVSEAIRVLSQDLRSNKYAKGEMQFTDITNRDYFLKAFGNDIRYCKPWDKFLVWNGTNWEIDDNNRVEINVVEFIHQMYRGVRYIKDPQLAIDFERHLIKSESYRRIQSMIGLCKMSRDTVVRASEFDTDPYLFNTKSRTINLRKNCEAREPDRADLCTKKSNFEYDAAADCPTWKHFLMQIMNQDAELIHYVQKAMGYALTGDVSEQCIFILWGSGANGKSTFLNTLQSLFGDYACSTGVETFMKKTSDQSNDLARLCGKRLVTTSETEQGKALGESLVKQITGEDKLTARFLYGEYFSFFPTFKIFMATNHKPRIKGGDYGIWRRIKLIPFTVTIPSGQRDKHLGEKLAKENAGILNWLLQGYRDWKKEGLSDPESVRSATEEYREDMDTVGTFLKDCCTVDATGTFRVRNQDMYAAYMKWCNANSERIGSQKYLALRLEEKGFKRMCSHSVRYWCGLIIKTEWRSF